MIISYFQICGGGIYAHCIFGPGRLGTPFTSVRGVMALKARSFAVCNFI